MNIEVHNISEYYEAIKKCSPSGRYFNKDATTLSWILRDPSEFMDPEIRKIFGTNESICSEALELLGKSVIYCGHNIGIFQGIEITEEDFYWVIKDPDSDKEVSSSCVGKIDYLDLDLARSAIDYYAVERSNATPTPISAAYIMGGLWREHNPSPEMIRKILMIHDNQEPTTEEIDRIREAYK